MLGPENVEYCGYWRILQEAPQGLHSPMAPRAAAATGPPHLSEVACEKVPGFLVEYLPSCGGTVGPIGADAPVVLRAS